MYICTYDICEPKRLCRVSSILKKYGSRLQKSIFQIYIDNSVINSIIKDILDELVLTEDSFYVYQFCSGCTKQIIIDGSDGFSLLKSFEIL